MRRLVVAAAGSALVLGGLVALLVVLEPWSAIERRIGEEALERAVPDYELAVAIVRESELHFAFACRPSTATEETIISGLPVPPDGWQVKQVDELDAVVFYRPAQPPITGGMSFDRYEIAGTVCAVPQQAD